MRSIKKVRGTKARAIVLSLLLALSLVPCTALVACGSDGAQNSQVADGQLQVATFTWSGGSGRLAGMDCTDLVMRDGQAWATIELQSSHYTTVRIGDDEYQSSTPGTDVSTFEIPVNLNADTSFSALTEAMSQPHWVDYTVYVGTEAAQDGEGGDAGQAQGSAGQSARYSQDFDPTNVAGLAYERAMDLEYANQFDVYYYDGGYKIIDVHDSARYLVVPEGAQAPDGLDSNIVVLQQPLDSIYLCDSSAMSLFFSIGADADVKFTATDVSGWEIDEPKQALESGAMAFAGKYSAPDYETLVAQGCDLALENTMILHAPDVQEMLEQLGIPVFIDRSSYEAEPLGRAEWARVFGVLTNREDQAEEAFQAQESLVESLGQEQPTGKTVVFFSVDANGSVNIRRPDDYLARAIEEAGGTYAFDGLQTAEQSPGVTITMEEFYATAKDADYLVYNGTIDDPLESVDDLLAKSDVFADFKAVREGNVWTCDRKMFQSTDKIAQMIQDFHTLVTDGDPASMTFLRKVG